MNLNLIPQRGPKGPHFPDLWYILYSSFCKVTPFYSFRCPPSSHWFVFPDPNRTLRSLLIKKYKSGYQKKDVILKKGNTGPESFQANVQWRTLTNIKSFHSFFVVTGVNRVVKSPETITFLSVRTTLLSTLRPQFYHQKSSLDQRPVSTTVTLCFVFLSLKKFRVGKFYNVENSRCIYPFNSFNYKFRRFLNLLIKRLQGHFTPIKVKVVKNLRYLQAVCLRH